MEIGSHDCLQEGVLSLEATNGDDEASMDQQQRAGSVPSGQGWAQGQAKAGHPEQQLPSWANGVEGNPGRQTVHHANMEDAHNLVAFSASLGSLPPASSSSSSSGHTQAQVQPHTAQLYERFNKEMTSEGVKAKLHATPEGGGCPTEDLGTLRSALSQAKHGHKPPNCDCDGPDCPDYLEWLEKRIKLAGQEERGPCKTAEGPPLPPQSPHPQPQGCQPQVNGGPLPSGLHLHHQQQQQQQHHQAAPRAPYPAPIPCSPQVLSIAKERNVSLQTAIAIEALTQLSATGLQASAPPGQLYQQHPQHYPQNMPLSSSSVRSQSVPPALYPGPRAPVSWEQHRPQSQGQPAHASPLPAPSSLPPGTSPHPQQWQQGPPQRNQWMSPEVQPRYSLAPHSGSASDPMTELKQLLGDNSGKFVNAQFKLPAGSQPGQTEGPGPPPSPDLSRVKQEPDSAEYYSNGSTGRYGTLNGQHAGAPMSPGNVSIRFATQAALQQHLHHKRNLFSTGQPLGPGLPGAPRTPQVCQNLRKWWPQAGPGPEGLPPMTIKQEPKEPKRRKSQGSPVVKAMRGGLLGGPPLPKPKQIVIKKTKQKASLPTFLPQNQISIQKPSAPALPSLHPGSLPSYYSQAVAGLPVPAQSQVSTLSTAPCSAAPAAFSENTPAALGPGPQPEASEAGGPMASSSTSTTLAPTVPPPSDSSQIPGLTSLDPKYEDLIRQFEAEFGDSSNPGVRQQQQQQLQPGMPEDGFTMPCSPLPKRMKIESSGGVTVLSTTACFSEAGEEDTPTKDGLPCSPSLRGFLESPMSYLDTPTKSLLDTPAKDLQAEFPTCDCVEQVLEKDEGPYYNHLGSGPTVASIRDLMETRYGEKGEAIRIEKVVYTGREGKSSQGCPIAKWVIRRCSVAEKLLCLVRPRAGHHCANAVIIILIMAWEGVPRALGDKLYRELSETITKFGNPTSRRCGLNDDRTCACQGKDSETCGASFSFGCSWSMYFNGCKYARSKIPRKFRLQGDRPQEEDKLGENFQELATELAPLYKQLAPQAYSNQCKNEDIAPDCRLGMKEGRPFSGVTACMDFCAHAHKDQHNLYNGCTVVCTLTKEDNRIVGEIPEDEQLHVLPLYKVSTTDEFGSEENQQAKIRTGAIQMLRGFRRQVRKLPEPAKSCRQRRLEAKKAASEKKKNKMAQQAGQTPDKAVIKAEVRVTGSPHPQGNKAIPKQEMKPTIKTEPFIGALDGYPAEAADPYGVYPHPAYYARGGLPSNGQPSSPGPVNGYHPKALPYGYYNYPPNALFPPKLATYEGRNGSWPKAGSKAPPQVDKKPDVQSLQARLAQAQAHAAHPGQLHADPSTPHGAYPQQADYQSRPSSVSSEHSHRGTPVIKQEPMDVAVYEGPGQSRSGSSTPCTTPQPGPWPGHKPNGTLVPGGWDGQHGNNPSPAPPSSPFAPDMQQFHPQQPSPYAQQWASYPGSNTPTASPAPSPSPSMKVHPSPSPSPHPGTPRHWDTPVPSPAPSPQPHAWPMGSAVGYGSPAGAYPDKMWSKVGESRSSTPLGLQEKAWKSCGGSVAGSSPSPAPEGRLFPDALQQQSDQACWDPSRAESDAESTRGREDDEDDVWSDSEHNFLDPNIGGVAVAPAHGSILIECARRELHATTPLKKPNRSHPTRISLVFYQHKNMNQPMHGLALWEAKMKMLAERALQRQQEAVLLGLSQEEIKALNKKRKWGAAALGASPGPAKDKREGPATRLAPTLHTNTSVTVAPYAFTQVTGPYSHFV
ncbi:methylcytosine dioxygenase TET3 [Aplochiton taeniatus]